MNKVLNDLKTEIDNLENAIAQNSNGIFDEEFYKIENQFEEIRGFQFSEIENNILKNIQKRLNVIKNDLDLYDAEGERSAMFPNGEDE